jgi:hypothetical protein
MTKAPVRTEAGTFQLTRRDESIELVCDRCLEPKITKITVAWTTPSGVHKTVCNGCFGRLKAKGLEH